jgi:hypothetical protein
MNDVGAIVAMPARRPAPIYRPVRRRVAVAPARAWIRR